MGPSPRLLTTGDLVLKELGKPHLCPKPPENRQFWAAQPQVERTQPGRIVVLRRPLLAAVKTNTKRTRDAEEGKASSLY